MRSEVRGEVRVGWDAGGWCSACVCIAKARVSSVRRARGGAHAEHSLHVCDTGRVETQRLVEGRRALRESKEGAYNVGRSASLGGARACGGASGTCMGERRAPLLRLCGGLVGSRERTLNIPFMVVTPEVSQLDTPVLKLCISKKT